MRVFLCHSSRDKAIVRELARALPRGISVWLDEREIHSGQDILLAIRDGIRDSGFLVAFLTDASLGSDWVRRELRIALEKEEETQSVCILPVVVCPTTAELPEYVSKRRYATLTGSSVRELEVHGPMKILAAIHPPDTAGAILECLGLPARSPPVMPARRAAAPLLEPDTDWSRD